MSIKKKPNINSDWLKKAETLAEALPFMREFAGETFVIKYGGHAMGDENLSRKFARDIVLLKQVGINPVVVHGGGPQISRMLDQLKIKSKFIDGLRVTDRSTVEIVEMVLSGSINKQIVQSINEIGGSAIGLSGKDGHMIEARKIRRTKKDPTSNIEQILDLGFVGEPTMINPDILISLEESGIIPIVAPIGVSDGGETYNINADSVAGAIASALSANKLIILTDVDGVMDKEDNMISELSISKAKNMIKQNVINGGMIPKVETCITALEHHTESAHILDGRIPHVLLLEIFTEHGIGTMLVSE